MSCKFNADLACEFPLLTMNHADLVPCCISIILESGKGVDITVLITFYKKGNRYT